MKIGFPLMKNVLQRLVGSVLIILRLMSGVLAVDAEIHKKMLVRDVVRT